MKRKVLATVLSLCMTTSLLAGCGNGGAETVDPTIPTEQNTTEQNNPEEVVDSEKQEHEPVELTLWVTSRNADDWSTDMEKQFLEEHPWITLNKVVKEGDPGNEFYQAVAAGNAPDLIRVSFTMMNSYMASNILEPLNRYVENWDEWENYTQEYVDMFTVDGNIYGVPSSVSPMLFGYNKALFEEAGISEPPKTWDEALEAAKLINNPDNQITGYATLAAEWTEWFFQYYVWQAGGDLTQEKEDGTAFETLGKRINSIDLSLGEKSNIIVCEEIPSVKKENTFYFKVTDKQSASGGNENIKVSPNMGIKIV